MQRYGTTRFTLIRQPRPADRESRFRPAKDEGETRRSISLHGLSSNIYVIV